MWRAKNPSGERYVASGQTHQLGSNARQGIGTYWVNICTAAVILGQIPPQAFIYVSCAQHQQESISAPDPRQ